MRVLVIRLPAFLSRIILRLTGGGTSEYYVRPSPHMLYCKLLTRGDGVSSRAAMETAQRRMALSCAAMTVIIPHSPEKVYISI